jgi:hypothetical protein
MRTRTNDERKFYSRYYAALKGGTIVSVDGGAEFPKFTVKTPSGELFEVEVSRDPEGNGPGFLFGLPAPA